MTPAKRHAYLSVMFSAITRLDRLANIPIELGWKNLDRGKLEEDRHRVEVYRRAAILVQNLERN